jgi:FeS assembly SUF system protein
MTESENGENAGGGLHEQVIDALREVHDPEIPVNIYDLGLIYDISLDAENRSAKITMTLTTPHCPEAEALPGEVRKQAENVEGLDHAEVDLVWDPPWDTSKMSEEAKLILGIE